MGTELIEKLSRDRWPVALRESEAEPREPFERGVIIEQGRRPEDVVQPREERQPLFEETPTEEVSTTTAGGKTKKFVIGGREYALNETQQKDLIEYGVQAFAQQQQQAAQAEAQPPVITNKMIDEVYRPTARIIVQDLIQGDLLDEDLAEVYEKSILTMIGQVRWLADRSYDQEFKQNQMYSALSRLIERAEGTIAWLNQHKAAIEGEQPGTPRQGKQFVTRAGGAVLLNKMINTSGRIRKG